MPIDGHAMLHRSGIAVAMAALSGIGSAIGAARNTMKFYGSNVCPDRLDRAEDATRTDNKKRQRFAGRMDI
jgi:hypothetical protein